MRRHFKLVVLLVVSTFSVSCLRTGLPVKRFRTHEDAGSVTVSIQSIAPFDEQYIEQLQPKIELPGDAAAVAQTQIRQIQQLRALLVQAGLGLPSSTVQETKTTTQNPEVDKVEFSKTETITPPTGTPAAPTITETSLPTPLDLVSTNISLDTALNSRALAALKQEIALLNRYVRDAAVTRGTRPYVVRLLVTLSPSARFEPYDAYTAVSLFSATPTSNIPTLFGKTQANQNAALRRVTNEASTTTCGNAMEVIPLFVTDNIESSLDSLAGRRALGFQGAVSGTVQNVAGNAGANFQSQDIEKAQARTLNSLQTISRLAANTIEARLGAMNAAGGYQMVSRTYNVTVLALVPTLRGYIDGLQGVAKVETANAGEGRQSVGLVTPLERYTAITKIFDDVVKYTGGQSAAADIEVVRSVADEVLLCNDIAFTALSRFVDVESGYTLRSGFATLSAQHLRAIGRQWGLGTDDATIARLRTLLAHAQYDSFDEFRADVQNTSFPKRPTLSTRSEELRMLWLDLISVARNSGRLNGQFALPQDGFSFFTDPWKATLIDNGSIAELTLVGSKNLSSAALDAFLEIESKVFVPASGVAVARDGRRATFTFPSPVKLLNAKNPVSNPKVEPTAITARVSRGGGSKPYEPQIPFTWTASLASPPPPNTNILTYLFLPEPPKPKTADAEMVVSAPHIVITTSDATGTLAVTFRGPRAEPPALPIRVRFNVDGGFITATSPNTNTADADRIAEINTTYLLTVKNLAKGGKLTVNAFQADKEGNRGPAIPPRTIDVLGGSELADRRGITP